MQLDVDFAKSRVKGHVDIAIEGAENPLSLDAVDIQVRSVKVNGASSRFKVDKAKATLTIHGVPGRASVVGVSFTKQVSDEAIVGLYKSKYEGDHFLVTDLEPAQARSVFPCKDDPSYKAVFRLSVMTNRELNVISNTPLTSKEDLPNGKARFNFEPTPRMSTYLFFVGIGRFEETKKSGRVSVIVAAKPGQSKNSEFILDQSPAMLEEFERYFEIPYPLPKLHLVALPEYHTGAMENWGAIASRESNVLLDKNSTTSDRHGAAHVICHEIAHQWFGDLTTMKWWDDLWLNESFATFMDFKILERLHPEWDNWRDFLRYDTFRSLNADALSGTHPIQAKVRTVEEIEGSFDEISYGKGAAVLRMLESYIGEEAFRKGVSAYLRKFSYSNAKGEDLWESLGKTSGLPVSRVARAWITKPGFPLVRCSVSRTGVTLRQEKFRLDGKKTSDLWPIPLTMTVDGEDQKMLFATKSRSVKSKDLASVLVNPRRTGFYSVLYDSKGYASIAKAFKTLPSHDRAGIVNDLYLFLQAGLVEPETYFQFVSASAVILDPLTTLAIADQLVNLRAIADEAPVVQNGTAHFYESQIDKVGLIAKPGEDESLGEVREAVSRQLARTSPEYARKMAPSFDHYETVEPNLMAAVAISYAMTHGRSAFDTLVELAKRSKSEIDRGRLYSALCSFSDPELVEKVLELTIGGEVSRSDSAYTLNFASVNPNARETLWKWIVRRYDVLRDIYGGSFQFYLFLNSVIPRCGIGREKEVHRFISGKRYDEGESWFKRTFELLDVNSALRQRLLTKG